MTATPAGWYPDPRRRHEVRYWDGSLWTDHVADRGVASTDPVDHVDPAPADQAAAAISEAAEAVGDAAKRAWNALRTPSTEADLATLADLHSRGVLTDGEYEAARQRLTTDSEPYRTL